MTRNDNPLNLHGRKLEIWQGRSGLPAEREEAYRQLWLKMQADGKPVTVPRAPVSIPERPNRCEHLGKREEHKHGCGGWMCRHSCELNLPAVPGGYCQTCDSYEDSGEKF